MTLGNDKLLYEEIETVVKTKISCGDFNLPHINWRLLTSDNEGSRLLKLMKKFYLSQFVSEPTLDNNILDIILASDPDLIDTCEVGEILSNSDHKIIRCKVNCEVDVKENTLLVPNYKKGNILGLKTELQKIDWQTAFGNKNVEQMCTHFTKILLEVESKWITKVKKRVNGTKNPQWMTNDIKVIINRKKKAYAKYKSSKSDNDFRHYIATKRHCERVIKKAKRNLEISISQQSKANPKKFYQHIPC